MKILISDAFDATLPEKLARFGEVTDDPSKMADADVILVRSKTKCTREYIDSATSVKLIIRGGVGLDNIDVDYARSKGIQVFNTASASSIAVAELAFALMIAVPTRLVEGAHRHEGGQVPEEGAQAHRAQRQDPGPGRRRQHRHRGGPPRRRLRHAGHRLRPAAQEPRVRRAWSASTRCCALPTTSRCTCR